MALFKIFRGPEEGLTLDKVPFHEGYAYFTEDMGNLYIDVIVNGVEKRVQVSSKYAQGLRDEDGNIINIYTTDEVDDGIDEAVSKAWSVEIAPTDWQVDGDKYSYTLPIAGLTCGKAGNVPPIITYTSNIEEYSKIESADATPASIGSDGSAINGSIKFVIPSVPENTIGLIITDNR